MVREFRIGDKIGNKFGDEFRKHWASTLNGLQTARRRCCRNRQWNRCDNTSQTASRSQAFRFETMERCAVSLWHVQREIRWPRRFANACPERTSQSAPRHSPQTVWMRTVFQSVRSNWPIDLSRNCCTCLTFAFDVSTSSPTFRAQRRFQHDISSPPAASFAKTLSLTSDCSTTTWVSIKKCTSHAHIATRPTPEHTVWGAIKWTIIPNCIKWCAWIAMKRKSSLNLLSH